MNVVPAQEAGVGSLAVTSRPRPSSAACRTHDPRRLRAARRGRGVRGGRRPGRRHVRLRHRRVRPASMVTGPGNIYVAAAKRLLKGRIGIDAEAGPTEIAVLADATADPVHVASDLVSQAEHDPLAASVLVTDSEELAAAVEKELEVQLHGPNATKHVEERIRPALTGRQSGIVLVDSVEHGLKVVDAYAAEHLEIQTADARPSPPGCATPGDLRRPVRPGLLGDYAAGSNHVLPTGGCACHSSGLSVQSFLRGIHVVDYTREALADVAAHVVTLADAEDLPAHGAAVRARFDWKVPPGK
ncbi:histidinol dehydrogenase [Streptomyces sp. M19]